MSFIKQMKNKECNMAIKRLFVNINIDKINKFIDSIECMSKIRKEFYKETIKLRYDILKETYLKI